jgi:hypothetical protein
MRPRTTLGLIAVLAAAISCGDNVVDPGNDEEDPVSGPTAQLRVVHTLANTPTLDVMVGGAVVLQSLSFGVPSAFVDVPTGNQPVGFRPAGSTAAPHTSSIAFTAKDSVTVFTIDSSSIINPWVLTDSGAVVPTDKSKLRVAHFAGDAPLVDIWRTQPDWQQFITIMFPFRYQEASPYVQSDPGVWRILVSTETRQGGIPVLTDTLLLTDSIDVPTGETRTVIVLDQAGGGLQATVIRP